MRYAARLAVLLTAAGVLVGACTSAPVAGPAPSGTTESPLSGGTLRLLDDQAVRTWDPQRLAPGAESAVALRTFLRTLTGYPPVQGPTATPSSAPSTSTGPAAPASATTGPSAAASASSPPAAGQLPLVGDLATDTGHTDDGGRTWVFTLRSGPAWQDGAPVTCADVKYGIARAFARDRLTGGSPYPASLIDVPLVTDEHGARHPAYGGPGSTTGQDGFDQAVACAGAQLTVRLKAPDPDFPAIAALPAFAAYRADHDRGAEGILDVFSCGPYQLDGAWTPGSGGRFVRNTSWSAASDPLRQARPDAIELREGLSSESIVLRLTEDKQPDDTALSLADLPSSALAGLTGDPSAAARVSTPPSGTVELLQPNVKSPVMGNPVVRAAFARATDRAAFAAAYGSRTMTPAYAVLPVSVPGHAETDPLGGTAAGDPAAARAALTAAGVTLPVAVRLAYRSSALADAAYGALVSRWREAGFEVTLEAVPGDYYAAITAPDAVGRYDVLRTSWFPDYPAGSAVIPVLFDGRTITAAGTGMDAGSFDDPAVDAAIDGAATTLDPSARAAAWAAIDASLATKGAHIVLGERHRLLAHGSRVGGYADNPWLGGWPDLAVIGVRG